MDAQTEDVMHKLRLWTHKIRMWTHTNTEDRRIVNSKLLTNLRQDLSTSSTTAEFMMRAVKEEIPDQLYKEESI